MADGEIKESRQARLEILRLYEEDPQGWYILVGRDAKGYHNTSIVHREEVWVIKEEVINPYERIGYAAKTRLEEAIDFSREISFGLRPIQIDAAGDIDTLMGSILAQRPLPASKVDTPIVAEGPYLLSRHATHLAKGQGRLEAELEEELERLIERRYGYLRRIYG